MKLENLSIAWRSCRDNYFLTKEREEGGGRGREPRSIKERWGGHRQNKEEIGGRDAWGRDAARAPQPASRNRGDGERPMRMEDRARREEDGTRRREEEDAERTVVLGEGGG